MGKVETQHFVVGSRRCKDGILTQFCKENEKFSEIHPGKEQD